LTRIPLAACSMVSCLVAEARPPFVERSRHGGCPSDGVVIKLVVIFATFPVPCLNIGSITRWVTLKNSARFTPITVA
jgi:hypothetical protein